MLYVELKRYVEAVYQVVALLGAAAFIFFSQVILARNLNPEDYGEISSLFSISSVLGVFASFGFGQFILNYSIYCKESELDKVIGSSLRVIFLFSGVMSVGLFFYAVWGRGGGGSIFVFPFMLFVLLQALNTLAFSVHQRFQMYSDVAKNRMQIPFIRMGAALFAILGGVWGFWWALLIAGVGGVLISCGKLKAYLLQGTVLDGIRFMRGSAMFGAEALVSVFLLNICAVALGGGGEFLALANINVALSIILASFLVPQAVFVNYLFPKYVRKNNLDPKSLFFEIMRLSCCSLIVGMAVFGVIVWLGGEFIDLFFGRAYASAVDVLVILAWAVPVRFFSVGIGCYIATSDFIKFRVLVGVAAVLCFFGVVYVFSDHASVAVLYSFAFVISQAVLTVGYLMVAFYKMLSVNSD